MGCDINAYLLFIYTETEYEQLGTQQNRTIEKMECKKKRKNFH